MDILFIVRDALANSLVGAILTAEDAQASGLKTGVFVTQEALAAAAAGTFMWPRELSGPEMRYLLADKGKALGLPLLGRSEGRQLDVKGLLDRAQTKGIALYACPWWSELLGLEGSLPKGLQPLNRADALKLLGQTRQVIGSL